MKIQDLKYYDIEKNDILEKQINTNELREILQKTFDEKQGEYRLGRDPRCQIGHIITEILTIDYVQGSDFCEKLFTILDYTDEEKDEIYNIAEEIGYETFVWEEN